ncbi:MAG: response regulator [Acidobacteriaceae bacterium]
MAEKVLLAKVLLAKVLLADDSATAQNMGKNILADAGFEVLTVNSAAAAAAELPEFEPDVVILDIYMQGAATGLRLCERLRSHRATASLPIMLAVGKMEAHYPDDSTHAGADAVIIKPFEASELIAKTRELAELAAQRGRPDYKSFSSAAASLAPVAQLWPAAAVAKIMGTNAVALATIGLQNQPADLNEARIVAAIERVFARSMPGIVAEVMAELRRNR